MVLDSKFFLKVEYFGWNFQIFLGVKKIENLFDGIQNFLECIFSKNDLE